MWTVAVLRSASLGSEGTYGSAGRSSRTSSVGVLRSLALPVFGVAELSVGAAGGRGRRLSNRFRTSDLALLSEGRQLLGKLLVARGRGVLVAQRHRRRSVPCSSHQFGRGGAGLGHDRQVAVSQAVKSQCRASNRLCGHPVCIAQGLVWEGSAAIARGEEKVTLGARRMRLQPGA